MTPGQVAEGDVLPRTATGIDWAAAYELLRSADVGDATDDLIDAMSDAVFAGDTGVGTKSCLTVAVGCARSHLSLRSAALALALTADSGDNEASDALVAAYNRVGEHPFLAPAMVEALGLLALNSPLARAQLSTLLLRTRPQNSRYLLVKAAQVIGRLDAVRPDPDLRAKLDELTTAPDPAIQAEARQQLALIATADALLAEDQTALRAQLTKARAMFARAEISEEHRPDAAMFVQLLDMVLLFLDLNRDREAVIGRLTDLSKTLDRTLTNLSSHDWHGYRSEKATLQVLRVLRIRDALWQAAETTGTAEEWVNFAAALEELARLHAQIRSARSNSTNDGRISTAMDNIADTVFATSLGPLLARVVQQRRLARITADYVLAHGEDEVARGLHALEQAATVFAPNSEIADAVLGRLDELAGQFGLGPETLWTGFVKALEERSVDSWAEEIGLASRQFRVERPELYGNDPSVDEVVRPMLQRIEKLLRDYPLPRWARLVDVLVSLVKFAHYVRDRTPAYLVCEEDGGLGQQASEDDLQDHLFEWIRQSFGRSGVHEFARSGGGRFDTGVVFEEAHFPVEVKHEFHSIAPEHVRMSYLAQSDVYATASDRVAFLMILDLRDRNAAGHRRRIGPSVSGGGAGETVGLYHLRDSFRVETLPTDPEIPNATTKVVVVGLVPGNRPLPSSMSKYSPRPASARRKRKSKTQQDESE